VGPAGTGKTTTMGAVARAWAASGGQVLGVSIAENASRILAATAEVRAVNAAKLIFEHTARSPQEKASQRWRKYAIAPESLVILDEAGMASREVVDQLEALCAAANAKLLLVGDPEQLDSPHAAGAFELIARRVGAVELGQVRRFDQAWERAAGVRLRAGDATVLREYDRRGRIVGGIGTEMEDAAFAAAVADRARGRQVYLLADTNEVAARLAGRIRDHLVAAGGVDDTRTVTLDDGNRVGLGDEVVTRDNDRFNRTGDGRFVANRDTWTVTAISDIGGVRVARPDTGDTVELEPGYVAEQVQLSYAGTIHAAQGGTRHVSHVVLSGRTSRHGAYVAMTRGQAENRAYVVCARPEGADHDGPLADPLAVLADILDRDDPPEQSAALAVQADEIERAASLATLFPIWQDLLGERGAHEAQTALATACGSHIAASALRSPAWPSLAALLRRLDAAGIDAASALADAARRHDLGDAEDSAAVLHWRLSQAHVDAAGEHGDTFSERSPNGADEWAVAARQVAAAMDARVQTLAARVDTERPAWAASLGAVPVHPDRRQEWLARARIVAGYREAFRIDTTDDPLGPPPPFGRPDAHAWWTRAAAVLDNTEAPTLASLPAEHLEAIIDQAAANLAAAPEPVADQLRRTASRCEIPTHARDWRSQPATTELRVRRDMKRNSWPDGSMNSKSLRHAVTSGPPQPHAPRPKQTPPKANSTPAEPNAASALTPTPTPTPPP